MPDYKLQIILAGKDVTQKAFRSVSAQLSNFTRNIFSVKTALAGMAGAAGLGVAVKKSLEAADAIAKTSDSIGIATDLLQEYRYAAGLSGVETGALDKSLGQFAKRLGEARQGTGAMITFLKKYDEGLLEALQGTTDVGQGLEIMFQAMENASNQADKAALANAAFGRSGMAMTVMVKDGSEALKAMRKEAEDLGIVMDEKMLRNAEKANDEMSKLSQVLKMQFMQAAVGLAPEIAKVAKSMTDWWKANQDLVKTNVKKYVGDIEAALKKIWDIIQYDPAILEFGLIGLAVGGKKGAVIAAGLGHMTTWASNLSKAMGLAAAGVVDFKDIATANFKELEAIVKKFDKTYSELGKKPPPITIPTTTPPAGTGKPTPLYTSRPGVGAAGAPKMTQAEKDQAELDKLVAQAQQEFQESMITGGGTGSMVEEQLRRGVGDNLQVVTDDIEETYSIWTDMSQRTSEAMEQAFSDFFFDITQSKFKSWGDYARGIYNSLSRITSDILGQMVKDWLVSAIKTQTSIATEQAQVAALTSEYYALAAAKTAAQSTGGGFMGFALGGAIPTSQPSIVGERGPEVFKPSTPGTIIPNNEIGGKMEVNIINVSDPSLYDQWAASSRGQKSILNVIQSNPNVIRGIGS